jgi:uncharacterized protein YbjT (DUF2867 family)
VILVTGATGNVGGQVVQQVAAAGEPVRALTRRPEGTSFPEPAELVTGDLAEPQTLDAALDGVHALFLLGGFDTMDAVLDRARKAGVGHVVLLTSRCVVGGNPENAITSMWQTSESSLASSGLPGTVLRPSGFQSNVLRWSDQLAAGEVVRAPWPDVPIAAIDPADIAAVATVALIEGRFAGEALELSGPQPLTPGRQVEVVAETLSRPLRYEPMPDDEARAEFRQLMPEQFVEANFRFFTDGEYDDSAVVDTVDRVTGRPAGTLAGWVAAHRDQFPTGR